MNLASLAYGALNGSGLTSLARRLSSGGVTLCYHNVVAQRDAGVSPALGLHMPLPVFERQMRWLAANYDVVPLDRLVDRVARGLSPRGLAAVTFDDGYSGVFEHAWPMLQDLRIPATVFVVAAAPEGDDLFWWDKPEARRAVPSLHAATWATVAAAAAAGLQVGAHSRTHRSLPTLAESDLQREIVESRDTIARHAGVIPAFFAYPFGHWDKRVRDAVHAAGYRAAFTLERGMPTPDADPWSLPRVNIPAGISDGAFRAWTAGLRLRA